MSKTTSKKYMYRFIWQKERSILIKAEKVALEKKQI
jgi:hypothetical protein